MAEMIEPRPPDRDPLEPTVGPMTTETSMPTETAVPAGPYSGADTSVGSHRSAGTGTDLGRATAQAGGEVLHSAKEQGMQVAAETGRQVRDVYQRAVGEVTDQAGAQQKRVVNGLYALSDEAARMAAAAGQAGPMTQLAQEASHRFRDAGQWLERREPGDVLREVKDFAREHPGTFLAGAAVLGLLAGRLTKNLAGGEPSTGAPSSPGAAASIVDLPRTTTAVPAPRPSGLPGERRPL